MIPKRFKVFASTIEVGYENTRLSNEDTLGECCYSESRISLCSEFKGKEMKTDVMEDTFYHEKVHVILDAMGEHELSANEKFVEVFSRLIRQSETTADFE